MIDFNIIICSNLKTMITDADIKKMKTVFATKEDLKQLSDKFETKFSTKEELKALDSKVDLGFAEIIKYIGETRDEIITLLSKQIDDFRQEMRDINRNNQSTLNDYGSRINRLEFVNKI